ncbi:MAG: hypothetical protein QNJ84_10670 [Alphaproteobacteria bacterium]|nr:hypothetical protein [Alphaproteobacteria bacterium]
MPVLALGAGGAALTYFMGIEKPNALGCYQRADQHKAAIWIDASLAEQSDAQLRDYEAGVMRAWDRAPANSLFMMFSTAKDVQGTLPPPIFKLCKPASNASEQAALGAPEKPDAYLIRQAADARNRFVERARDSISQAVQSDQRAGDSPILEQLRAVSVQDDFQGASRYLTIITDGIQNSSLARFCQVRGHMPTFGRFAERLEYRDVKPNPFTGADVSVLLVETVRLPQPGLDHCTHVEMRAWWRDYFNSNGAARVDLTPLRYWGGS